VRAMANSNWSEGNQRYLAAALSHVQQALEQHIALVRGGEVGVLVVSQEDVQQVQDEAMPPMPASAALASLCAAFSLSPFERDVLLLCAGVDLDSTFAALCAEAQGQGSEQQSRALTSSTAYPTFRIALSMLPDAHWDALTPVAPLRRWQLIIV
jgi:uncharacterized protein (DUF1697 family)